MSFLVKLQRTLLNGFGEDFTKGVIKGSQNMIITDEEMGIRSESGKNTSNLNGNIASSDDNGLSKMNKRYLDQIHQLPKIQ